MAEIADSTQDIWTSVLGQLLADDRITPQLQGFISLVEPKGVMAGTALARVYKRLRALPGRGHAAAPWSQGNLPRREFDALFKDVAELCRTLGAELSSGT